LLGKSNQRNDWEGHIAQKEEKKIAYNIFIGKSEGKRPL
jgi:hypothetical protein